MDKKPVRLTEITKKGGCAAKLPAGELRAVLKNLKMKGNSSLVVGTESMDDACLYRFDAKNGVIQTVDFFTPIVDDPYDFGRIAAANSISDVYAMGANPKIALTVLCFPSEILPIEILEPLMRGAIEKIEEAGATLAGGHTIDDDSLKLGFCVTGFIDPDLAWKNSGAKPGDVLILTKGLGTGTIATALKEREAKDEWVRGAIESMCQLNNAPELLDGIKVNAATDITGFGLCGHALQLARASGVGIEIDFKKLPLLDGAMACLENEMFNRAHKTNMDYVKSETVFGANMSENEKKITVDAQTSGGLLLCIPVAQAESALKKLSGRFPKSRIIGKVVEGNGLHIHKT